MSTPLWECIRENLRMITSIFKWLLLALPLLACFSYMERSAISSVYYRTFTNHIEIPIVHINDSHANYYPVKYMGVNDKVSPFALIKGFYNEEQHQNPNTLLVSAGDTMEKGSVADFFSRGQSTIEIFEQMKFNYVTLGNHDFAYGLETVKALAKRGAQTTLSANLRLAVDSPWAKHYDIKTIEGIKVAFLGLTAAPFTEKNQSYHGPIYANGSLDERYDFVETIREQVNKVRHQADVIVLITHVGLAVDKEIATAIDGIDLIIGGHSHSFTFNKEEIVKAKVNNTVIVQAASHALLVGMSRLWIDPITKQVDFIDYKPHWIHPAFMPQDSHIQSFVETTLAKYAPQWDTDVCVQKHDLNHHQLSENVITAAVSTFNADAAFIAEDMMVGFSTQGAKSQQDFINRYFVEIQNPGSQAGWTGLYKLTVSGQDLNKILQQHAQLGLNKYVPEKIDNEKSYTVITHKKYARNLGSYFNDAQAQNPAYLMEMFELMTDYCSGTTTSWSTPIEV